MSLKKSFAAGLLTASILGGGSAMANFWNGKDMIDQEKANPEAYTSSDLNDDFAASALGFLTKPAEAGLVVGLLTAGAGVAASTRRREFKVP